MNNQDLESLTKTFNKSKNPKSPISSDEELQRVSAEFNFLNKNFFECLESHRYFNRNQAVIFVFILQQKYSEILATN